MDFARGLIDYLQEEKSRQHIPGIAVLVVKDNHILLSQGLGYANLENKREIDMDRTLFRVASISKTFTVTAVLQLAAAGKIDLEAPVNDYLTHFKIANRFSRPQKVRDLLCHIDGFEEKLIGNNALQYQSIPSLESIFEKHLRPLFIEPGTMITYGNTGIALASYLVEKISGMSFEDYVANHIFIPLEMTKTTLSQNFSEEQLKQLATIYVYRNNSHIPLDTAYSVTSGTGGASVIPNEMAHYLMALLNQGKYKTTQLLSPEMIDLVLKRQFSVYPNLPGVTLGLFELMVNGQRALARDGSGFSIHARIALWPESNAGLFIVTNKASAACCIGATEYCFNYFAPLKPKAHKVVSMTSNFKKAIAGEYMPIQYSRYSISKVLRMFMSSLKVDVLDDENIIVKATGYEPFSELQASTTWQQIEPGLFDGQNRKGRLFFKKYQKCMHLFSGIFYHSTYQKLKFYEKPGLHKFLFRLFPVLFFLTLLGAIYGLLLGKTPTRFPLIMVGVVSILSMLSSGLLIPFLLKKGTLKGYPSFVMIDAPPRHGLTALFALPFVNMILLLPLVFLSIKQVACFGFTISIALFVVFILLNVLYWLLLKYWNLLRFIVD